MTNLGLNVTHIYYHTVSPSQKPTTASFALQLRVSEGATIQGSARPWGSCAGWLWKNLMPSSFQGCCQVSLAFGLLKWGCHFPAGCWPVVTFTSLPHGPHLHRNLLPQISKGKNKKNLHDGSYKPHYRSGMFAIFYHWALTHWATPHSGEGIIKGLGYPKVMLIMEGTRESAHHGD